MTTNVPKGAGRGTAAAKRTKAAQRTPLPPRPGQITDEMLAEAAHVVDLQKMTVAALRKYAREHNLAVSFNQPKAALFTAILELEKMPATEAALAPAPETTTEEFERLCAIPLSQQTKAIQARIRKLAALPENTAEGKAARTLKKAPAEAAQESGTATKRATLPASAPVSEDPAATKSIAKADVFLGEAKELGWSGSRVVDGESATATVKRGGEVIEISWLRGVFQGDTCLYICDGRTGIKIHNASAAKKRMALSSAEAQEEAQKVSAHKAARAPKKTTPAAARRRRLPFDPKLALDEEILSEVRGRNITWVNSISGTEETARVTRNAQYVKIEEGPRGRVLTFPAGDLALDKDMREGWRSLLIENIVAVR
jgi:hypothetical protein